ncbi:F-box protein At4g09920-like [Vigna angularis]|uniref:F-box protein At4g09920-like n=1 Tax=Phaseolus angularis TaxID=3914 RepID=UPI00080A0077|nr:F-box protein At4g09920-like [Vigna angularis]
MEEEKETMVELKTQTKKKEKTEKEREDEKDLISALPDNVLVHIIHFVDTATAVRTFLLSKRWNNLWKSLTTLSFRRRDFKNPVNYNQFVHHVLSHRDTSIRLHSLDFDACVAAQELLNLFIPLLHYVPHLRIFLFHLSTKVVHYSIPIIFSSPSLTSLTLVHSNRIIFKLPQSLELPALKTLSLTNVSFTARNSDDECAEPFSSCFLLNSLFLMGCSLSNPAKVLSISNPNLSRFTMTRCSKEMYNIVLSTPNLTHLAIRSCHTFHEVSSTCDLALLEEANIEIILCRSHEIVLRLLKMLSYAKILMLSECVVAEILHAAHKDMFHHPSILPPHFVRLQTLKVENFHQTEILMKYLLQNSQLTKVEIIQERDMVTPLARIQVDYAINAFQKGTAYFVTIAIWFYKR